MIDSILHSFERAGMGCGPFAFVGVYEMPDFSEGSAFASGMGLNPYADAPKLVRGLGTCACCGHAITYICIVRNAAGELYGVGSDCVEKTGDAHVGDPAKIAVANLMAQHRRDKADAKRKADYAQYQIDHAAEIAAKAQAFADAQRAEQERIAARTASFGDLIARLLGSGSDFHISLGNQLASGPLSDRQAEFVAKFVFGRCTKKNNSDFEALLEKCIN